MSRVNLGWPQRGTATPPMKQNRQPRWRNDTWSFASMYCLSGIGMVMEALTIPMFVTSMPMAG